MKPYKKHLLQEGSSIILALDRLNILARDAILFIVDNNGRLLGSLTDGDVRRGLLNGISIHQSVDSIIQKKPKFLRKGDPDIQKVIQYRDNDYRIIPIIDANGIIVNVVNFRDLRSYLPVDAVIMAGGKGERLRPLTNDVPKPLLKVGDKPILEHNLTRLRLFGIDDIWLIVNFLGKQVEDHFGNGHETNIHLKYIYEDEPLGTIGSVSKIQNFEHDYVLITNSDLLTNIDYEKLFLDFLKQNADCSVVSVPYRVDVPYAVLETKNGQIESLHEKPSYTYYSNGGIYLMKRQNLEYIPKDTHFDATELIELLLEKKKKVVSFALTGYWLDIGRPEDYKKANIDFNSIKF